MSKPGPFCLILTVGGTDADVVIEGQNVFLFFFTKPTILIIMR
jgi:hypothetical protein